MRTAARLALAFVLIVGVAAVLPRPAGQVFSRDAHAQVPLPTPTIPDILPSTDPLPNDPSDDDDDDEGDKKKKDGSGGSGKTGGTGSGTAGSGNGSETKDADALKKARKKKKKKKNKLDDLMFEGTYVPGGKSYTTNRLVGAAALLRSLGVPQEAVDAEIYPPFIVAGRAAWQNTWGAPRFGPGPIVREHEGQDVFCSYGDPVLAPVAGLVSYSDGGLGGVTARVHVDADEYWYLTHLSATNEIQFPLGSRVESGDVIGFCGNSGNALTTPPHVHFGWYVDGKAQNPHRTLIRWLRTAEDRAAGLIADTESKRLAQIDRLTAARRFGDAFTPSASELEVVGESLWASGSSPTGGALSLAEAALETALYQGDFELSTASTGVPGNSGTSTSGGPVNAGELATMMRTTSFFGEEHNHD